MAQIDKSSDYFNTVLYTGNGSTQYITGVGFQPDWVWVKDRDVTHWHTLTDAVRGTTKVVFTNSTTSEVTLSNSITSFDSDGFTTGNEVKTNNNGDDFVSWNWLASNTTASNTDGSITSTVSANTTSGFSIVSYTGTGSNATIGHGLSAVPAWIITKNRDATQPWRVYHKGVDASAPEDYGMILNDTSVRDNDNTAWNDTAPTSSVFSVGTSANTNNSGDDFIAYCFAEKKGFSKFGSYTGNGSADGTFVYTGFKPMWVLFKRTDSAFGWYLYDSVRDPENQNTKALIPTESDAEQNESGIDLLSNGFKLRNADGSKNASGGSYIYMCFAENPLVSSAGVPCTAR